jgi:hypothetical protein
MDFYWEYYKELNPDLYWAGFTTPSDYVTHFQKHGKQENRKYRFSDLFPTFDLNLYKKQNPKLLLQKSTDYEYHYFLIGRYQKEYDEKKEQDVKLRFGFFLTGFGEPNVEVKKDILLKNLEVIKGWKDKYDIDLYIYLYTPSYLDKLNELELSKYVSNVYITAKPGIVGEFIYREVSKHYHDYDYIFMFLDDIELPKDLSLEMMMIVYNKEQLDILGLPLTIDSPANHSFMYQNIDMIREGYTYRETNFIEYFVYFISSIKFPKYLAFYNKETRWCWGIDLALHNNGIKLGMLDSYPLKHYFKACSYSKNLPDPTIELNTIKSKTRIIKNMVILNKQKY